MSGWLGSFFKELRERGRKMQKHKYPGKLGRPMSAEDKGVLEAAKSGNLEEWVAQEWTDLLILLCEHYGIPISNPTRLAQLCLALAFVHVPGFSTNAPEPRRRRGRPAIREKEMAGLPSLLDHIKAVHHLSGYGSEKKALDLVLRGMMRERGISLTTRRANQFYKKALLSYQKILSKARSTNSQKS